MMATVPPTAPSLQLLLATLEDSTAGHVDQTDAYLTITRHLSGKEKELIYPVLIEHFPRLGRIIQEHIASEQEALNQAALHVLGFCVFHDTIVREIPANMAEQLLTAVSSVVVKSPNTNTCMRALWVIGKQNFPHAMVVKKVPEVLVSLENVFTRKSASMELEALNVFIKLVEQAPEPMGVEVLRWARLIFPLLVHAAPRLRQRAAYFLELGLPLLLEKQKEVANILEPLMIPKLLPELKKLFVTKNECHVLKLWSMFVKLLGQLLHKGGPLINAMLLVEECGFRNASPEIKKIAFIAWKCLIDNFALNPDILTSMKRLKLLMQPLMQLKVRTDLLQLTKVEVWWYLLVRLGPNMAANFELVGVPLLQCTLGLEPPKSSSQSAAVGTSTPKSGRLSSSSSLNSSSSSLNSSRSTGSGLPAVQVLGLEMLLHYFLGAEVTASASKNKLQLGLEPLSHSLLSAPSSFSKHAPLLISLMQDGFIAIGNQAPEALLTLIWSNLVLHVRLALEAAGQKKDRQGCEPLTLMLTALQNMQSSEALSGQRILSLLEITARKLPPRVLGSASYQVGKMDVLNGTPALFLSQLLFHGSLLPTLPEEETEKFFTCLQVLVSAGLAGPTSPLAFGEALLEALGHSAALLDNKDTLLRAWTAVVHPLTDIITKTNEVNQGDALDHNFSAVHAALMFPITHLLSGPLPSQKSLKSMLASWSCLYKVFARCAALVATAEENICCLELCTKMVAVLDTKPLPRLGAVAQILLVIIECVDFSPYTAHFQQKTKSPHTPAWLRKGGKARVLGNLFSYQTLLVAALDSWLQLEGPDPGCEAAGLTLLSILSCLFTNLALPTALQDALACFAQPLTLLLQQADRSENEQPKFSSTLAAKLEKLLSELLGGLQARSSLAFDDALLGLLAPLLCSLFLHRQRPLRSIATSFWNNTFAKTSLLTYPDELRSVLTQVKQNTPIILPGFEAMDVHVGSGQYSSESSQLETKLSGVPVASAGKRTGERDSLLGRASEPVDRSPRVTSKPVSTRLDFGSPKPPRRVMLEEEESVDFVFIPPETKERVLTEHQKEVKRTKRADIPAMYNNLDASLDTSVFSQYTQSQGEALDKPLADDQAADAAKENKTEVEAENMSVEHVSEVASEGTLNVSLPAENNSTRETKTVEVPESPDVSMEEGGGDVTVEEVSDRGEGAAASPNVSSDMISGTPQKSSNSRRQSFVTLEKYADGQMASPIRVTKFTGPLTRTSNSQEPSPSSSKASTVVATSPDRQAAQEMPEPSGVLQQEGDDKTAKTEDEPKAVDAGKRTSVGSANEDDVIPDTQVEAHVAQEVEPDRQVELESSSLQGDSQDPLSLEEPRRSGRRRSKPLWQGDGEVRSQTDSQKTDSQLPGRVTRRSHQPVIDAEQDKLRNKASLNSQSAAETPPSRLSRRLKLKGDSEELSQSDSQTNPLALSSSNSDSQLAGRQTKRMSRASKDEASSQRVSPVAATSQAEPQPQGGSSRKQNKRKLLVSNSEVFDLDSQGKEEEAVLSQVAGPPSATQTDNQSQGGPSSKNKVVSESQELVRDDRPRRTRREGLKDKLSQNDSQVTTPSSGTQADSQSQGRSSRRSKVDQTDSQPTSTLPVGMKRGRGRPPRSLNSSTSSQDTQESSQSSGGRATRQRPHLLLSSDADTDSSETREESQTTNKKSRSSTSSKEPLVALESTVVSSRELAIDRGTSLQKSESSEKAKQENTPNPETNMPNIAEVPLKSQDCPIIRLPLVDTENSMEQGEVETRRDVEGKESEGCCLENVESENTNPASQMEKPSSKPDKATTHLPSRRSPRKMECSESTSQSDFSASQDSAQLSKDPGPDGSRLQNQQQLTDPSSRSDISPEVVSIDASFSSCSPSDKISPSSANEEEKLSPRLQMSESSEEKGPLIPQSEGGEVSREKPEEEKEVSKEKVSEGEGPEEVSVGIVSVEMVSEEKEVAEEVSEEKEVCEEVSEEKELPEVEKVSEEEVPEEKEVLEKEVAEELVPDHENPASVDGPETDFDTSIGNISECSNTLQVEEQQQEEDNDGPTSDSSTTKTREEEVPVMEVLPPLQENVQASGTKCEEEEEAEEETQIDNNDDLDLAVGPLAAATLPVVSTPTDPCMGSPAKQRDLEGLVGPDVGESPSSRARGAWSPSASPSTSILKKGQKRIMEEETPSPLIKSRRVSFADPIQHQELADDIDRRNRSPIIRTSSPKTTSGIPKPKINLTPTKGLALSPRNLHSPGYKSSKKCLHSELQAIPRDCVYPPLLRSTAPVETVLSNITLMARGFVQLIRARNIKTVGDLSALTPSEIKTLPIRSPKVSNVKKALRSYHEQQTTGELCQHLIMASPEPPLGQACSTGRQVVFQRKSRSDGVKEEEMEKMASDNGSGASNQEDEDKALATALDESTEQEGPQQDPKPQAKSPSAMLTPLLSQVAALGAQTALEGLAGRSVQELVRLQAQLVELNGEVGVMMRSVVDQLQTRLGQEAQGEARGDSQP